MAGWKHKVQTGDVFSNDELSFLEKRDEIVKRLRESSAAKDGIAGDELLLIVDELADTTLATDFDVVMDEIYDLADGNRWLWLEPFG